MGRARRTPSAQARSQRLESTRPGNASGASEDRGRARATAPHAGRRGRGLRSGDASSVYYRPSRREALRMLSDRALGGCRPSHAERADVLVGGRQAAALQAVGIAASAQLGRDAIDAQRRSRSVRRRRSAQADREREDRGRHCRRRDTERRAAPRAPGREGHGVRKTLLRSAAKRFRLRSGVIRSGNPRTRPCARRAGRARTSTARRPSGATPRREICHKPRASYLL